MTASITAVLTSINVDKDVDIVDKDVGMHAIVQISYDCEKHLALCVPCRDRDVFSNFDWSFHIFPKCDWSVERRAVQ